MNFRAQECLNQILYEFKKMKIEKINNSTDFNSNDFDFYIHMKIQSILIWRKRFFKSNIYISMDDLIKKDSFLPIHSQYIYLTSVKSSNQLYRCEMMKEFLCKFLLYEYLNGFKLIGFDEMLHILIDRL